MREIKNLEDAKNKILHILREREFKILGGRYVNRKRHFWFVVEDPQGKHFGVYLMFKRSFFLKYAEFFEQHGFGDSINIEFYMKFKRTQEACKTNFEWILIAYPHAIYKVDAEPWMEFIETHQHTRIQKEGETTVSFPINILENWGKTWTTYSLTAFMKVIERSHVPVGMKGKIMHWIAKQLKKMYKKDDYST